MLACEGEAYVHIGGLDLDETAVVISDDSDIFFLSTRTASLEAYEGWFFHLYQNSYVTAVSSRQQELLIAAFGKSRQQVLK
jgi:hypothetical protein